MSEAADIRSYKQTKNKRLSASRKDKRKYIGGRNRRKRNYRNNRFEKTSSKQRQIKFFNYDICDSINTLSNSNNYVIFDYSTKTGFDKGVVDTDAAFHYDLKYLLSLKQDHFLGEEMYIKYFNDDSCQFKGTLVCISNSGQYKLSNITYCGIETYKKTHLHLITDSFWFHMNCTQKIYINYIDHENYGNDVTKLIKDIIKLKMVKYFLFICSFHSFESRALKYLYMENYSSIPAVEMNVSDNQIKNCEFIKINVKKFIYGKKQRDFAYLQRINYSKINPMPTYLHHKQFIDIICSYKQLIMDYVLDKKQSENKQNEPQNGNENNFGYLNWDNKQIINYKKLTIEENRTV
eukprot:41376_1